MFEDQVNKIEIKIVSRLGDQLEAFIMRTNKLSKNQDSKISSTKMIIILSLTRFSAYSGFSSF
jgi:hypothetical protein